MNRFQRCLALRLTKKGGSNSRTSSFEIYDIANNNITNTAFLGTVGLNWQLAGFSEFNHDRIRRGAARLYYGRFRELQDQEQPNYRCQLDGHRRRGRWHFSSIVGSITMSAVEVRS